MEKSPSGSVTHEVGEAPYWQPTGAGDELQQPHPLLVVHLLYELQEGEKKEKEGKIIPSTPDNEEGGQSWFRMK